MRDYNSECHDNDERSYIYGFDRIMHQYIVKKLSMFGYKRNALEVGCYKGDFSSILLDHFDKLTIIEASENLASDVAKRFGDKVNVIASRVEDVDIGEKFDHIFIVHTLEHIDEANVVLSKLGELLSDDGKLFVVTPNANAPSRQIAVKMGIIDHNSAVTEGESLHGHVKTYSLDTLEAEASGAGLNVIARGGVMFKPLANFQMDLALENKIIDEQFIEGCFSLGEVYPDLCSSIYVVCQKSVI